MRCTGFLKSTTITHGIIWMLALSLAGASNAQTAATKPAGLRILVIAGEDAVNVIQQKTAVSPVIEVRDTNGQPVAGAVVRFAIQGGKATFSGARTLSVTTNAAGRAAVTGRSGGVHGGNTNTLRTEFTGALNGDVIVGTLILTQIIRPTNPSLVPGGAYVAGGSASYSITLR